ncbi:hypothetical protein [Intestinibacillus massiliensis]|uniref:hypothetical protein n=1 Tax=Intestinibacillus massiliensis TaxID=1871029 RepID=UPI000B351060|nr:hypothetical protein [Intestinibacillus massiliensis]
MIDDYRDWAKIERLPLASETAIRSLLPEKNIFSNDILASRSEKLEIPRSQWNEIQDPKLPDAYAKQTAVDAYFSACVYVMRRSGMLSIAAQQSIDKTETILHTSSMRQSTTQTERLDTALDASKFTEGGSVMAHIGAAFELTTVTEYATEESRTSMVEIRYEQCENDRDVVFWDVAKVVVLYRVLKPGFETPLTSMVALGDFYHETYQKTYTYMDANHDIVAVCDDDVRLLG